MREDELMFQAGLAGHVGVAPEGASPAWQRALSLGAEMRRN